jgi:hypothetical protein
MDLTFYLFDACTMCPILCRARRPALLLLLAGRPALLSPVAGQRHRHVSRLERAQLPDSG